MVQIYLSLPVTLWYWQAAAIPYLCMNFNNYGQDPQMAVDKPMSQINLVTKRAANLHLAVG